MTKLVARGSSYIPDTGALKPRDAYDHYPTPEDVIEDAFEFLLQECPQYSRQRASYLSVLDPGAGTGVWGHVASRYLKLPVIDGVEVQERFPHPPRYDSWFNEDFFAFAEQVGADYDLIVGNPPYRDARKFVETSYGLLQPGGHVLFLLRLAFLEGQDRARTFWRKYPPKAIAIASKRPSFTGDGRTDAIAYMICLWENGFTGSPRVRWTVDKVCR